jgi:hypothetical protein
VIANRSVPSATVIPVLAYVDVTDPADWGGTLIEAR